MKKLLSLTVSIGLFIFSAKALDDKNIVPSVLKTVTVYRSGAELYHEAKASLKQGSSELVIEGISSYVDINSLQINCPAMVAILGVEFSNNYLIGDIALPAVKKLQDSVDKVTADISQLDIAITTSSELLDVLKSNKEIKGTQTGLSVAELMKLMDYYKLKSNELQGEIAAMNAKKDKLGTVVNRLNIQIVEERKKNTATGGRVILQLLTSISGNYDFKISYITQNAFWTPYYDIKAVDVNSPMQIIYKARIAQTTGIDWKKVKLSLSTSTPMQYDNAPLLKSWFLAYINPVAIMDKFRSMSASVQNVSAEQLNSVRSSNINNALAGKAAGVQVYSQSVTPLYIINGAEISATDYGKISPMAIKNSQMLQADDAIALYGGRAAFGAVVVTLKDGLDDYISVTNNELDLTYDIELPYDVPTNGKAQIATLKEAIMNATYKYYSVPKLDKDAFLIAAVSDWEKLNLLPGEANIIFEGTYIGKTFIDPASTNDTLNLTLGKDKRVVIKREKLKDYSSAKFIGTNKVQTITYEITVKNNKKDAIKLSLKDQYPISTNKEIDVQLLDQSGATNDAEIGVLNWKLDLAPGESKKVRLSYSVKYPKGKELNLN